MDNSTSSQRLEEPDKKFPSTFDIQGFQSAKVTTVNKIPKPIINAHKRIFHMEENSQKSKESSIRQIEVNDLDEILLDDKVMSVQNESENNLSTERLNCIDIGTGSESKKGLKVSNY